MRPSALVALACLALASCAPAVHVKAASAYTPSGWNTALDAEDGVSLGVAPGWREGADVTPGLNIDMSQLTTNPGGVQASMDADAKQAEKEELARLRQNGTLIQIIDGSKPTIGEDRTRYYVFRKDHGGNYSLAKAVADEQDHLRGMGLDPPTNVELPIGPAAKLTADRKLIDGDESTHVSYVVVDGPHTYSLRFVSTNNPQAIQSIADEVAKTWRIRPGKD